NWSAVDSGYDIAAGDESADARRLERDDAIFRADPRRAERLDERIERLPVGLPPALDQPGVFLRPALQLAPAILAVCMEHHAVLRVDAHIAAFYPHEDPMTSNLS